MTDKLLHKYMYVRKVVYFLGANNILNVKKYTGVKLSANNIMNANMSIVYPDLTVAVKLSFVIVMLM